MQLLSDCPDPNGNPAALTVIHLFRKPCIPWVCLMMRGKECWAWERNSLLLICSLPSGLREIFPVFLDSAATESDAKKLPPKPVQQSRRDRGAHCCPGSHAQGSLGLPNHCDVKLSVYLPAHLSPRLEKMGSVVPFTAEKLRNYERL